MRRTRTCCMVRSRARSASARWRSASRDSSSTLASMALSLAFARGPRLVFLGTLGSEAPANGFLLGEGPAQLVVGAPGRLGGGGAGGSGRGELTQPLARRKRAGRHDEDHPVALEAIGPAGFARAEEGSRARLAHATHHPIEDRLHRLDVGAQVDLAGPQCRRRADQKSREGQARPAPRHRFSEA